MSLSLTGEPLTHSRRTLWRSPSQLSSRSSPFYAARSALLPRQPSSSKRLHVHLKTKATSAPELGTPDAIAGTVQLFCHSQLSYLSTRFQRFCPAETCVLATETGTSHICALQAAGDPGKYCNTDWASAFKSQLREYDYWATKVEGTIPDTLRGTLFRNGPGRLVASTAVMHRAPTYVHICRYLQSHQATNFSNLSDGAFRLC